MEIETQPHLFYLKLRMSPQFFLTVQFPKQQEFACKLERSLQLQSNLRVYCEVLCHRSLPKLSSSFMKPQLSSVKLRVQHSCSLPNILRFPSSFTCSDKTLSGSVDAIFCKSVFFSSAVSKFSLCGQNKTMQNCQQQVLLIPK